MLDGGFVAKAGSFKPRPSFLDLGAQVKWYKCFINLQKGNALFHEPKAHKEVEACQGVKLANPSMCDLELMSRMN